MLLAYLNNPSEQTIFGSNRIKNQHETMKLQMKKLCKEIVLELVTRDVLSWEQDIVYQIIFRKVLPNHIYTENIDEKIKFYDSDETEIRLPF